MQEIQWNEDLQKIRGDNEGHVTLDNQTEGQAANGRADEESNQGVHVWSTEQTGRVQEWQWKTKEITGRGQ